ncbi:MAG: 8-oxo-dGTP pyrophosphatase MutT (NUDIX family) [Candidatus Azotimanducaceae bacterium]|jgi:8-oxo-dGTP pyrophosphatase MutT (NUDIX family)
MSDYDPDEVEIRPAATVMLIADRPNLQVFMMERNANIVFAGGMWVFPGGRVDATDSPLKFQALSTHRTDAEASALMNIEDGGLSYYIGAIRESFEEAGILLALDKVSHEPLSLAGKENSARFNIHRNSVNASERDFLEIIEEENLILDAGAMHYIARWVTPKGPPRRYDTRFFISRMPENQIPLHDDNELVHSEWISPQEILAKVESEDMILMSPTLRMIQSLAKFSNADDVIAAASANLPDERARVNKHKELVLPGDPFYDEADENIETGFVRLRPL